jgi:putative secretion ATPase (PEP-CTERM system associated)
MYEKFYGLKEKPFQIVPNPRYLYMSPVHDNALTYLEYGLMENVGFILLTGEVGTGKTTLVRYLLDRFESEKEIAVIFNTNVTADELLSLILQSFELEPEDGNKTKNLEILQQFLIDKYAENKQVLLIIDEAQNLSDEALEEVRMLSNLQSDEQNLLQIMLVGQPELKNRLQQPGHVPFAQRIAVNFFLSGLTDKETESYIAYRLEKAGGRLDIFNKEAVNMIYEASMGIPRSINLLCDSSLVYGFGYELETIDASIIKQVISDKGGMGISAETENKESSSSSYVEQEAGKADWARLQRLEDAVRLLQIQMDSQVKELEHRAEGFKDDLVRKLNNLLLQERKRNDKLLVEYSRLKARYDDNLLKTREGDLSDQKWIESLIKNELEKKLQRDF